MMNDSYHIYFKGEILFKNLSKDEFEFVWGKLELNPRLRIKQEKLTLFYFEVLFFFFSYV